MKSYPVYNALGNIYAVIDPQRDCFALEPRNIVSVCKHLQTDGILYGPIFKHGDIHVRIFNPDGSEAEKSGNGTRIFAQYLRDQKYILDTAFNLQTLGGTVQIYVKDPSLNRIEVNLGVYSVLPPEMLRISSTCEYPITYVDLGNPHAVVLCDTLSPDLAKTMGPLIENHPRFPHRTNVQFVKVIDRNTLSLEIWERGAGYTHSSGTCSAAAVCAAHHLWLVDTNVCAQMPGGHMQVTLSADGTVCSTGEVHQTLHVR